MSKELHIILGAAGPIGKSVSKALKDQNKTIRHIIRNTSVEEKDVVKADLLDSKDALKAIEGGSHVYLCVGLEYNSKVWEHDWPIVMRNVIDACEKVDATLIFLDNIYMYGPSPLSNPITESHRQEPSSRKGKARKIVSDMLLKAMNDKKVRGVIGRSADFYGPNTPYGSFNISFMSNMSKGKNPQYIGKGNVIHNYAYTDDIGRALVVLALDVDSYGEVWHLPTCSPLTIEEVTALFSSYLKQDFKVSFMPKPMLSILGLFIPILKEVKEMFYQFEHPYNVDDSKFRSRYTDFEVTPIAEGIKALIDSY